MKSNRIPRAVTTFLAILPIFWFALAAAAKGSPGLKLVYYFTNDKNPYGNLLLDSQGYLYGTTVNGGDDSLGTVFKLAPYGQYWQQIESYSFYNHDGLDGFSPYSGVVMDAAGNLYGTTLHGGAHDGGTVFEIEQTDAGWIESVIYSFCSETDCQDGANPYASLIFDAAGNLYGTTYGGGDHNNGTVFELSPIGGGGWAEKVLHRFINNPGTDQVDGYNPYGGVTFDAAGNLYGTTVYGGTRGRNQNYGTVFKLFPSDGGNWKEEILYSFPGAGKGYFPHCTPALDAAGNIYGTTLEGGLKGAAGTVFGLSLIKKKWQEKVLHSFGHGDYGDGIMPVGGVILDAEGNLYGSTSNGGNRSDSGVVFKLASGTNGWTYTRFQLRDQKGASPQSGLIFDQTGNLLGTASKGGEGDAGTIFRATF